MFKKQYQMDCFMWKKVRGRRGRGRWQYRKARAIRKHEVHLRQRGEGFGDRHLLQRSSVCLGGGGWLTRNVGMRPIGLQLRRKTEVPSNFSSAPTSPISSSAKWKCNYLREFPSVLSGKTPFTVCSTFQGTNTVWVPVIKHTESCCITAEWCDDSYPIAARARQNQACGPCTPRSAPDNALCLPDTKRHGTLHMHLDQERPTFKQWLWVSLLTSYFLWIQSSHR